MADTKTAIEVFQKRLDEKRPSLLKLAPMGFDPDALIDRVKAQASLVLYKKPDLLECDLGTVLVAVTHVVELGLDLSGPLPTAYIVPFKEKGVKKAQAMISYTGLRELAVRSGCVKTIQAEVVHEHDKFRWEHTEDGLQFSHTYDWEGRGKVVGFYAHAVTPSGFPLGCRMSRAQVDAIRDASPAFKFADFSPWKAGENGYIQMGCKTLIRRMAKSLTLSPIMTRAIEIMDQTEGGLVESPERTRTKLEILQSRLDQVGGPPTRDLVEQPPSSDTPAFDPAEIAAAMDRPRKAVFDSDGHVVGA